MVVGQPNIDYITTSKKPSILGLGFPVLDTGTGGFFTRTDGLETIMSGLKQLILTSRGERPMRPDFGTNLRRFVFEPFNASLKERIKEDITSTVEKYEPRVKITSLEIAPDERMGKEDRNVVFIRMYFQVKGDILNQHVLDLIV
jgi:hypothetical protein